MNRLLSPAGISAKLARVTALLVLTPLLAPAESAALDAELLRLALHSPHERAGNYDALIASWLEALPRFRESSQAELLLRRLQPLRPFVKNEPALLPLTEKALEAKYSSGVVEQMLLDLVADLYRKAGREEDRQRVRSGRGFLLRWVGIGPFGKAKSSLFLLPFPPESELKLDAEYRDGWQKLRWRKVENLSDDPLLDPAGFAYPGNGVSYFVTHVRSDDRVEAALQRGSEANLRIWVNGFKVVDDDVARKPLENRRATPIRLARGWNRVLVKSQAPFWVRIATPTGHSFPPGKIVEDEAGEARVQEGGADPRWDGPISIGAIEPGAKRAAELDAAGTPSTPEAVLALADVHMGLAMLEESYGREELAVNEAGKATQLAPDDALLQLHAGNIFRQARYLPSTIARNRAQTAYEAALAKDPELLPAYERVAKLLEDDQKHPEAMAKLQEALGRDPGFLRGLLRLQAICSKKQWSAEEIAAVGEIARVAPSSTVPGLFWADYYQKLENSAESLAWLRKTEQVEHGQPRLLRLIAGRELSRGNVKEAEAAFRTAILLEPDSVSRAASLIELLTDQGRHDEAIALATKLTERFPADPENERRLAEVLAAGGKTDLAAAALARARALDPGDLQTRRVLTTLLETRPPATPAGAKDRKAPLDEFWAQYDEKLEDWVLQVPTSGPLVDKAASINVLDITIVRLELDGSSSQYIHEASKLLSEESKESLANVTTDGEVISLRTLTQGGESLEPVAGEGSHSWVMPGLTTGSFVEFAYRDDSSARHGEDFHTGSFSFQDVRFRQSYLLSRYVILVPAGLDVGFIENNIKADSRERPSGVEFAKVEKSVRDLDDGGKVVVYEARGVPRLEREQQMPSSEEYIPNVQVAQKTTWEDAAGDLRDRYTSLTLPSPELEAAARTVTAQIAEPLDRAKAIYDYVNKTVPTEGKSFRATAVLLEKSGNRNTLFKALLDLSGVPNRWAFLRPQEAMLAKTDWDYPSSRYFPYPYIVIELEGKAPQYVSLSDRNVPFGRLPEHLEGGKALVIGPTTHKIEVLQAGRPEENAGTIRATLKLDNTLDVGCDVEFFSRSVTAFAQKEQLRTIPAFQKDLVLRQLANQLFPGAKVKSAEIKGLDEPAEPFVITASLTAPKLLKKSGEGYLLKAVFQPSQLVKSFAGRAKREHPFHFRTQRVQRDTLRIEGGGGYKLDRAPADVTLASALGTYSLNYKTDGNNLLLARELTLLPGRLSPDEFPAFVDFCEKVDAAERESIIFRRVE